MASGRQGPRRSWASATTAYRRCPSLSNRHSKKAASVRMCSRSSTIASSSWRTRGSARSASSCSTPRAARAYMLISSRLLPTSGGWGGGSWTAGRSCSTAPLAITYSSRSSCSMLSAICIVGPTPARVAGSRRVISAPNFVRCPSTVGR
nr:hypothetical protein [Human alphaherpesvirus 2]